MRCFIAIDIDEKLRKGLGDLQRELAHKVRLGKGDVRWVNPKTIHLTLKFLGEVKDERVVEICSIVENVAAAHKGFEVSIESVGCFGGRSARVLWVGTGDGSDELGSLAQDLEGRLAKAGWREENRRFKGHLTLCRIKRPAAGVKLAALSEDYRDYKLGSIWADSLSVYQSQLTPSGPIYTVLGNFRLQ
jgi:2'-5' RNA ligase